MSRHAKHFFEFGAYRIDARDHLLLRDGEVVPLPPKTLDLLLALVESNGRVLTKEELMKLVWPDSFVEEANLSHHVFTLRKALGEDTNGGVFIETIPRRGYRFVAGVTEVQDESDELVLAEHSRSRIVIEQTEAPSLATGYTGSDRPARVLALAAGTRRRTLLLGLACAVALTLAFAMYFWKTSNSGEQTVSGVKSIAVLPFKPLVAESHDEYLELGMADTLITRLSSLKQIVVRPTSAVRKYTDLQQDALEAGRELQVESVLDGGIQRLGDRLRVTVRLINVKDGATLWADKFDEKATDLFAVQDAISERLAGALALKLSGESERLLSKHYTSNLEAYQLYVQGRSHWSTFDRPELEKSIKYFNAALEKDPTYALAYSGLANVYSVMGLYGLLPPKEAYPKAREAVLEALRLDDNLAEAHASLGAVMVFHDWDWSGAEREFKRAMELDPNNMDAHGLYGYCLQAKGLADEAVVEERRAHEIDPVWQIPNNDVAIALYLARRYDEAIKYAQDTLKLNPDSIRMLITQGHAYLEKGMPEDAISAFKQALKIQPANMRAQAGLGFVYAKLGKRIEAMETVKQIKAKESQSPDAPQHIAAIYAALGEKEQAFVWLEKAYEDRNPRIWGLRLDPRFDSLRSDERFRAFLRRVNLLQ